MYSFRNDYSEGAHPQILARLQEINHTPTIGYGQDEHCENARQIIRRKIGRPDAAVYFVSGGTQANLLAISSVLRPHEAVIAADTGHIAVHETGAIEATGHKVIEVHSTDGKLHPPMLERVLQQHPDCHMVKPRLVYISHATEIGGIYSREELSALYRFCRENDLLLYLDGARIGSAIMAEDSDLQLPDIAERTDCFTIGGTKNGALFGEALVLCTPSLQADFPYLIKQRGAMLAKGWLLGIQFSTLFTDGIFYENARHANRIAMRLKAGIQKQGYAFLTDSTTNQQFPIFPAALGQRVQQDYGGEYWESVGEDACIRLTCSWATPEKAVQHFLDFLPPANILDII